MGDFILAQETPAGELAGAHLFDPGFQNVVTVGGKAVNTGLRLMDSLVDNILAGIISGLIVLAIQKLFDW
mgnify:CR=1 FL=1